MWNYILLIIGIPIALFIVYRFFGTLSIGGRAIAIGLVLGSLLSNPDNDLDGLANILAKQAK